MPERILALLINELQKTCSFIMFGQPYKHESIKPCDCNLGRRQWFSIIKACDFVIGIDSALQHIATAVGQHRGVFFWAGTAVENFGYPHFENIERGFPKQYYPLRFQGSPPPKINADGWNYTTEEWTSVISRIQEYLGKIK
jgi:hypothetical protein